MSKREYYVTKIKRVMTTTPMSAKEIEERMVNECVTRGISLRCIPNATQIGAFLKGDNECSFIKTKPSFLWFLKGD